METKETLPAAWTRTVEDTLAAFEDTWNRHDVDGMTALFTLDADFVNVLGMRLKGRAEIEAVHAELHRDRFAHTHVKPLLTSVNYLGPDVAIAHVRWEMTGDPGAGPGGIRRGTMTHVLVRKNGEWLFRATQNTDIVRLPEMESDPFWSRFFAN